MEKIDFDALKKMHPELRVEKLREAREEINKFIEEKKQEIDEAEEMLTQAEQELSLLEQVKVPKQRDITVEELLEERREQPRQELEGIAREATRFTPEQQAQYVQELARQRSADQIYHEVKQIYQEVKETGILTPENQLKIYNREQALQEKEELYKRQGKKPWTAMTAAEQIIESLKSEAERPYRR